MDLTKLKLKLVEFLKTKNYELYDVLLEEVDQNSFLVIKIENIELNEIVALNEPINKIVDENFDKYYKDPYFLEITSAGINRELKTIEQQEKQIGQKVIVQTKNSKFVSGILAQVETDFIIIDNVSEDVQISRKKIIKIILDN